MLSYMISLYTQVPGMLDHHPAINLSVDDFKETSKISRNKAHEFIGNEQAATKYGQFILGLG